MTATIQTMAGLGASQARVMVMLMRAPAVTFDAAVGAFVDRAMPRPSLPDSHPPGLDPQILAAYADGVLDESERSRAEAHLLTSAAARDIIALAVSAPVVTEPGGAYTA